MAKKNLKKLSLVHPMSVNNITSYQYTSDIDDFIEFNYVNGTDTNIDLIYIIEDVGSFEVLL